MHTKGICCTGKLFDTYMYDKYESTQIYMCKGSWDIVKESESHQNRQYVRPLPTLQSGDGKTVVFHQGNFALQ